MSFYESLVEWFLEDKLGNHQAQQKKKKKTTIKEKDAKQREKNGKS